MMPLPVSCRSDVITTVGYYTAQYDSPVVTITSDLVQNIHSLMSRFLSIPLLRVLSALFLAPAAQKSTTTSTYLVGSNEPATHARINQSGTAMLSACL